MTTSAGRAIRGRIALVVLSALALAGIVTQQYATAPASAGPLHITMACMSEAHPAWGLHSCGDPAWSARP